MKDLGALRARFVQDDVARQLGGLASNLSRIGWFLKHQAAQETLAPLFRESKYFSEWAAPQCSLDVQSLLAEVQVELSLWERYVGRHQSRETYADEPEDWSRKLLAAAGLVTS